METSKKYLTGNGSEKFTDMPVAPSFPSGQPVEPPQYPGGQPVEPPQYPSDKQINS